MVTHIYELSVIFNEDMVSGGEKVATDEERY